MPFAWLAEALPQAPDPHLGSGGPPSIPRVPIVSFADSIAVSAAGARVCVRVVASTQNGRLDLDFQDSDAAADAMGFGVGETDTRLACALALATALGPEFAPHGREAAQRDWRWVDAFGLRCGAQRWIGSGHSTDPGRRAMSMTRVYDALLGALANAWPGRVGAGSNSLGAVVQLKGPRDTVGDVLAGGEGGLPHRPGRSGWSSPILRASGTHPLPRWVDVVQRGRVHSAGGGARPGGQGVERRYEVRETVTAHVGIDRIENPPHGIDRAGPPAPAEVILEVAGQPPRTVNPWSAIEVPAGATLVVRTAGGAGHGFGGYGDIEFDASEWFGSKPADEAH